MEKKFRLILAEQEIDQSFEYYSELVEFLAIRSYININDPLLFVANQYEKGRWAELSRYSLEQEIESFKFEQAEDLATDCRHARLLRAAPSYGARIL